MTLLDASELMRREDFKTTCEFTSISSRIIATALAANSAVLLASLLLSRTLFSKAHFLSPGKLLADASVVFASYYGGAMYLSCAIE